MIYIYFPFYKPVYKIHTFTIPMHYFVDSIYRTLNEHSYKTKMLTNPRQLYNHKLNKDDLLIINQNDFLHSFRSHCIPPKLEEYLYGIEKNSFIAI